MDDIENDILEAEENDADSISEEEIDHIEWSICDRVFPVVIIPEPDVALDIFNKSKDILNTHGLLDNINNQEEDNERGVLELNGFVISAVDFTVNVCDVSDGDSPNWNITSASGDPSPDNEHAIDEILEVISDSGIISTDSLQINLELLTEVGVSKTNLGFGYL